MMEPATVKYARANHAPEETVRQWKALNSPKLAAASRSRIPPTSICAPELITFDSGNLSLRERTEARDQLIAPTTKASAPDLSIGVPPKLTERLTRTATPA